MLYISIYGFRIWVLCTTGRDFVIPWLYEALLRGTTYTGINGSPKESLNKYIFICYLLVKIDADYGILGFICYNEVFLEECTEECK